MKIERKKKLYKKNDIYIIMSNNKGIPTIGVRGIQFRSRIEAQWAYIYLKNLNGIGNMNQLI